MPAPTTSIYLNSTDPAAPTGNQNVKPQTDGATPQQSITFYPQQATPDLLGVVVPDGVTITVDDTGKLTSVGTGLFVAPVTITIPNPTTVGLTIKGSESAAVPAYVQGMAADYTASLNTFSLPSPTAAGNSLLVVVFAPAADYSLSDSQSNSYTSIYTSSDAHFQVYLASDIPGGDVTFTMGLDTFFLSVAVAEYSGLASSDAFDVSAFTQEDTESRTTSMTVGAITTTAANDLIVALFASDGACTPIISTGYHQRLSSSAVEESGTIVMSLADQTGAEGSYSATWSSTNLTNYAYAVLLSLKATTTTGQTANLVDYDDGDGNVLGAVNAQGQIVLPSTTGLPTNSPTAGALAYDSTTQQPVIYNGSEWESIGGTAALATTSAPGIVQPDGTTITITAGVISAAGGGGGGGGGAVVLLQELTASNSATLDFTSWYSSGCDAIFIELINVKAATNGVGILMQVSRDGGSTWDTGGNYDFFDWSKGVSNSYQGYTQHNGASAFQWWGPDANDLSNSFGFSGTGHLLNVTGSNIVGKWSGIGQATSGAWYEIEYGAAYMGTGPVNGLQFLLTSGNITSGTIRIYGLSN